MLCRDSRHQDPAEDAPDRRFTDALAQRDLLGPVKPGQRSTQMFRGFGIQV
jgi:hypothetical protein